MSGNNKKIIFLINTLDSGGAELVLINTVNMLAENGFDVTLKTVIDVGVFKNKISKKARYESMISVKNAFLRNTLAYFISFIAPPGITHKLFIGNKYDYEVAFLEGVPTKIISASSDKKSVKYAWVHIDLYNTVGPQKAFKNLEHNIECYKKFDKIICVAQTVKDAFIKKFGTFENIEVKYNIVDDARIKSLAGDEKRENDSFTIVSVGRLDEQKGFDRLLKVFKRITGENIDCRLQIVGQGTQRAEYEKYIKENSLEELVDLVGFTNNPYQYMKDADLCVFPSRAEGYSTVVTEAVIIGKPIVATDCSGMKEILGDSKYGLVTENNDEALYQGIKQMLLDEKLREEYEQKAKDRGKDFKKITRYEQLKELFE